ncbi:hypothetical protein DSBG_4209 [Desulfosporosinus sp. BG]|nr:hypothetical protein DSBG_4209 [Desulfosporosinus sp. BG]
MRRKIGHKKYALKWLIKPNQDAFPVFGAMTIIFPSAVD